ncbi:MAG TPA: hypothetical protein VF091_01695 [Gaiellaceae bacterium]
MTAIPVLILLGIARLLPEHGFGLWLRLAAATLLLLLPGRYVARAFGQRSPSATFVWSVGLVAVGMAVTFAVHSGLWLTLLLVFVLGAAAVPLGKRSRRAHEVRVPATVTVCGLGLGIALWSLAGVVGGDGLFHLGRIRKLLDFGSLHLRTVDEFKDGGLHPGYAFPLWHGWLALVAKLAGVDATEVVRHEASILAPLALVLAYELGHTLFRSAPLALATVLAQAGMIALAPGGGGSYSSLELPGTTARQLLVPAASVLFFRFVRAPSRALACTLAVAGLGLAFVHPTYALFLAIPLAGFAAARWREWKVNVAGLVAYCAPILLVFIWLLPIVRETIGHNPSAGAKLQSLKLYHADLVVHSPSRYRVSAGIVDRTGAIAIAALMLVPLAAFASRRRWSAYVLGGTAVVLVLELSSMLFPHFSDLVSLSQSRRAAGFVPFSIALVGGAAVLRRGLGLLVVPLGLAAGIALQLEYPGDFGRRLTHATPGLPTWIALFGGLAALALVLVRSSLRFERMDAITAAAVTLFVLPVAIHGFANWETTSTPDPYALTPGVVHFLGKNVPKGSIVYSDLETSYRISAYLPVYVANAPPTHVANTRANNPKKRRRDLNRFLRTHDLSIPRSYGAGWLVLTRGESVGSGARLVYRDARFRVYRL